LRDDFVVRVVDEITGAGGKAIAVQADVSKKAEVERLFAKTQHVFGRLDILVNNAGIYEYLPLEVITQEHFHKHFDLNVLGLILTSQQAAKYFGSAGGSIINISSIASTTKPATASVYRVHVVTAYAITYLEEIDVSLLIKKDI